MWCEAEFDPDSFWRQTPCSFQAAMRGRERARAAQAKAMMIASVQDAYNGEAFARTKDINRLRDRFLSRMDDRRSGSLYDRLKAIAEDGPMRVTEEVG
ncbi:hypothetical protein ACVOMT_13650 [Sphingomonas panni]